MPWWTGKKTIPEGYVLCDGKNNTPDLRGYKIKKDDSPRPQQNPPDYIMKT